MNRSIWHYLIFCILVCNTIHTKQRLHTTPAHQSNYKAIIFDLGDVVFKLSKGTVTLELLPIIIAHPSAIKAMRQLNIKQEIFETLAEIPATSDCSEILYSKNQALPKTWTSWMLGKELSEDVFQKIVIHIQNSKKDPNQQRILCKIMENVFKPKKLAKSQKFIKHTKKLIQRLKSQGYKLYILSNWDKESFPLLKKRFSHFFAMFNDIIISGNAGIGKPNQQIYIDLLQKHNLQPSECIFIDDEPSNVAAAQSLQIQSILKTSDKALIASLQELGIVQAK